MIGTMLIVDGVHAVAVHDNGAIEDIVTFAGDEAFS